MGLSFGSHLRELRRAAKLTQRDLAGKTQLDFSYLSKLENDRIPPPAADTVVKLAAALKVQSDELLALSGKLPSKVAEAVSGNPAAQGFLRETANLNLSDDDWRHLGAVARELRRSLRR